jgi:hypothetical protein
MIQAPPKEVPKTIENMRVKDVTMVPFEDEEVHTVQLMHPCADI